MRKLFIEFRVSVTPSLNAIKGKWGRQNIKKRYEKEMQGYELIPADQTWLQERKKRKITIERHGKRLIDYDNFVGGCKSLTDLIKQKGLIVDDSPEWVEIEYQQYKSDTPITIVKIEQI